tara:strand:+ start:583 stop:1260 length:678 start_codon:yes stop_codon:yes gene_type:complete
MIILTGISGGIGKKIAGALAKKYKILGIYNSNKPERKIRNIHNFKLDLTDENQIEKFIKDQKNQLKKIIFISLAAFKKDNLIINKNIEEWEKTLKLNLNSNFIFSKKLIDIMIYQKWGRFIFFGSSIIKNDRSGIADYAASKFGLLGLSGAISSEYKKLNITSNILELGAVETGLYKRLSRKRKNRILNTFDKKMVSIEDIINSIEFIINNKSLNNSIIKLDNGM